MLHVPVLRAGRPAKWSRKDHSEIPDSRVRRALPVSLNLDQGQSVCQVSGASVRGETGNQDDAGKATAAWGTGIPDGVSKTSPTRLAAKLISVDTALGRFTAGRTRSVTRARRSKKRPP